MRNAGKAMGVQIDQPGRHNLTGYGNGPLGFGCIDVPGDRRYPAAGNRHIGRRVEGLRWVDDPSSLKKEVVFSCLSLSECARPGHQDRHRDDAYHLASVHALAFFRQQASRRKTTMVKQCIDTPVRGDEEAYASFIDDFRLLRHPRGTAAECTSGHESGSACRPSERWLEVAHLSRELLRA